MEVHPLGFLAVATQQGIDTNFFKTIDQIKYRRTPVTRPLKGDKKQF